MVIRPVKLGDLDDLLELAGMAGFGLTTLPKDRELLRKRIVKSQRSFENLGDEPGGENCLFVMEDRETGKIVGTCGIVSKVGGFEPFYAYRVETSVHQSADLGVRKEIRTLHLVAEHNGPAEICSLFLSPAYRKDGNGRLLSLSRFLFMAEHPQAFDPLVIAEMRGVIDDAGRSPFWDALGKHFFEVELPKADYLSIINKRFIADLMPKHPIYIPLLPPEAQKVIGQVHQQTLPALKLLEGEGFHLNGHVDIFEGGPVVICPLARIRSVRDSRAATVGEVTDRPVESEWHIIANTRADYRAVQDKIETAADGGVRLSRRVATMLEVAVGDTVRYVPSKPPPVRPEPDEGLTSL
ncbi:MAG: arginine N-succinyltransferase [Tepidisphaerales bacterium]